MQRVLFAQRRRLAVGGMLAAGALGLVTSPAGATIVALGDGNSTAAFDTESSSGMSSWVVDGVDHMFQQWFWHRIGDAGPESPIHSLGQTGIQLTDSNPFDDVRDDTLAVQYGGAANGYTITASFALTGGSAGSNTSNFAEVIEVENLSNEPLDLHFFQYSDFDLGDIGGDTVEIIGPLFNTARISDPNFVATESVVTPPPSHYEANFFASTRTSLEDAGPTTLNDDAGPLGPADTTWAFQWDATVEPRGTFQISKLKGIVPEPGVASLLALAGVPLLMRRRRSN